MALTPQPRRAIRPFGLWLAAVALIALALASWQWATLVMWVKSIAPEDRAGILGFFGALLLIAATIATKRSSSGGREAIPPGIDAGDAIALAAWTDVRAEVLRLRAEVFVLRERVTAQDVEIAALHRDLEDRDARLEGMAHELQRCMEARLNEQRARGPHGGGD